MIKSGMSFNHEKVWGHDMTNLQAVEKVLSDELAQPKPNEAVIASCALFKAACERKPDPKIPPEGLGDNELPWWIK